MWLVTILTSGIIAIGKIGEGDMNRGRSRNRSPQNRGKLGTRSKSRGRPTCFYCGKTEHFQKNYRHFRKDKGGADDVQPKRIPDNKNTWAIATSEEELLVISEQNKVNLVIDESTWAVDSGASFHLTPNQKCFSSYKAKDHDSVKMGNEGACRIVGIGDVCLETSTGCNLVLGDV